MAAFSPCHHRRFQATVQRRVIDIFRIPNFGVAVTYLARSTVLLPITLYSLSSSTMARHLCRCPEFWLFFETSSPFRQEFRRPALHLWTESAFLFFGYGQLLLNLYLPTLKGHTFWASKKMLLVKTSRRLRWVLRQFKFSVNLNFAARGIYSPSF